MTTNDIISHRLGATDFYKRLHATTLGAACKEPLKINDLVKMSTRVMIPTGHLVDYGTAVCFACIQSLLDKYQRRVKPDAFAIEYMAEQMTKRYSHWSVLDLPTFVNMTIMARLPSMKYGEQEYELLNLDIPSIMGKTEVRTNGYN